MSAHNQPDYPSLTQAGHNNQLDKTAKLYDFFADALSYVVEDVHLRK
jgi:hypothetical protein